MNVLSQLYIYSKMSLKTFLKFPNIKNTSDFFRYFGDWVYFHKEGKNPVEDKMPWMNFGAINFLKKIAAPEMLVFEYGSGGSTLFWAKRVKRITSVEHDPEWYLKMKDELAKEEVENVEYFLIEPEFDPAFNKKDFPNPADYISRDECYKDQNFEKYVKFLDQYPDNHFHIILIDGRARPSCIKHAIEKLKNSGYLIVDNTEREYYLSSFNFDKATWRRLDFFGPVPYMYNFTKTTVFQKQLV